MSRRKIIDLPLLEQFANSGVRPLVTGLATTNGRVQVLESKIPTKVSSTLLAANWVNDEYSLEDDYPSSSSVLEVITFSDNSYIGNQYIVNGSLVVDRTYRLHDSSDGTAVDIWIELTSMSEVDEDIIYEFNAYSDSTMETSLGEGTLELITSSNAGGYTIDIYLNEDIATRAQRDAFVDATMSSSSTDNIIVALDGAPSRDIPIILEVVRTSGVTNS